MNDIIIDDQFKFLLPDLDPDTYRLLEESLLEHGCREPLVIWKDSENGERILIDGYNRYKICTEHNISFRTVDMEFASRENVLIWIIQNQISRRNLTPIQLGHFRGLHYQSDKKIQGRNNQYTQKSEKAEILPSHFQDTHTGSTASRLAEQYKVSHDTIKRDAKLAAAINSIGEASPEAKRRILNGDIAVSRTKLEALNLAAKEEIEEIAAQIEEGTYARRAPRNPSPAVSDSLLPEIKQLNGIISNFASNFNSMFQSLNNGDAAEVKPVLRSFIDELEDLYESIR